jgi:hypothetical protein
MTDTALIAAYRAAVYRVFAEPPFDLRVGAASAELDALLAAQGVSVAAFVTAWNPGSVARDDSINQAGLDRMEDALVTAAYAVFPAEGVSDDGTWSEPSLLVMGLPREEALTLAREHGQMAFLSLHTGEAVALVTTGDAVD